MPTCPDGLQRKEAEGLEHLWEGKSWARQNRLTSWVRVGERENSKVRSNFLPSEHLAGVGRGWALSVSWGAWRRQAREHPRGRGWRRGCSGEVWEKSGQR